MKARACLDGRTILVTRPAEQAGGLVRELEALGARVLVVPAIEAVAPDDPGPLDRALRTLATYHWMLLTSSNAVRFLTDRLRVLGLCGLPRGLRVGCIGPATGRAFGKAFPQGEIHAQPHREFRSAGLAAAVLEAVAAGSGGGEAAPGGVARLRFLIPTSDRAGDELPTRLRQQGAEVDVVVAYRTASAPGLRQRLLECRPGLDLATFASPSAVEAVASAGVELATGLPVGVIGPLTEAAARRAGMDVQVVAACSTSAGLVDAIRLHLAPGPAPSP